MMVIIDHEKYREKVNTFFNIIQFIYIIIF